MISKPKYTTYNIYIRDESKDPQVLHQHILEGLTIRILIPDTTEKYRIPHEIASDIETELQTYMLTEDERQQAKQVEKTDYNKGIADAWEAARKIIMYRIDGGLKVSEIEKIFGTQLIGNIFKDFDASEAIAKIKAYEKEQNEIKVGDEVCRKDRKDCKFVVTAMTKDKVCFDCISKQGVFYQFCDPNLIEKTGRHFPQIEELLKVMKEEK